MNTKKILAWILTLAMSLTLLFGGVLPVSAANPQVKFTIANVTNAVKGQTVTVNVSVNGTLAGFEGTLNYNASALTLKSIDSNPSSPIYVEGTVATKRIVASDAFNASFNGVAFTCTFAVASSAANGKYEISIKDLLAYDDGGGNKETVNELTTGLTNGSITVVTAATSVTVNPKTASMVLGGSTKKLTTTVAPSTAPNGVTWSTSNAKVATVSGGVVTAKGAGKATITATALAGGKTGTCVVTVTLPPVTSVTLSPKTASINAGKTATLKATIAPAKASTEVTWKSSDTKVATVKNGVVTGVAAGKATITVTAQGGKTATCAVTVTAPSTYVSLRVGKAKAIQNGKVTNIDNVGTKPFKISGRTMLPLRFVGEKMGGKVNYISSSKPITMTYGTRKVEFKLNSKTMKVYNGGKLEKTVTLDVPAQLKGTKTYIPLRAIGNALGFQVHYENGTEYIIVSNPSMSSSLLKARLQEAKKYF